MPKHQGALIMRGTPNQRTAVAGRAIVRVTTARVTTNREKGAISPVQDIIRKAVICLVKEAIVPDTTEKAAPSLVKAAISPAPDIIARGALSKERAAISPAPDIIARVALSKERAAISPAREVTIAAHVLPITILMPNTA